MRFWKPRAKRLAALVCALALTASLLPTAVFADTGETLSVASSTVTAEEKTKETPAPDATEEGQNTLSVPGEQPKEQPSPEPSESPAPEGTPTPSASPEVTAEPTESPAPSAAPTESPEPSAEPTESPEPAPNEVQTFAANAPVARAPEDVGTVYLDEEKGINVSVETGAVIERTVHFVVVVDGETVEDGVQVDNLAIGGTDVTIIANRYKVSTSVEGGLGTFTHTSGNIYRLVPTDNNITARIELTSFKTADDIEIAADDTVYGTFSWMKGNADRDDFARTVTIEVNGKAVHTQTVYTPQQLNNALGSTAQYWFTPNSSAYNAEVEMDPPYALDTVASKNLTIRLTTKCPCGSAWCECPGGTDCTCEQPGCDCELCKPAADEKEIRTDYGVISYKEPSANGYNMTVEVYVNGTKVVTSDKLRIRSGENNCLNFEPANGYYYFNDENSYDIVTNNEGSSWDQRTGYISIVGALEEDRDFDNVLKVYLWTFQNHIKLNVDRKGDAQNVVTGYVISFDAYDPATKTTKTYTYTATSFRLAQAQMIPYATNVTIKPICESPYEVSQWSSADAYTALTLTGSEGQSGTEAYGNAASLYMTSTAYDSLTVNIDGVRKVTPPTDEKMQDLLGDAAVKVSCNTKPSDHTAGQYALLDGSYDKAANLGGNSVDNYTYTITVKPDAYVTKYNDTNGKHTNATPETQQIVFEYVAGAWTVQTVTPVEFKVTCEEVVPEEPDVSIEKTITAVNGEKVSASDLETLKVKVGDTITYQITAANNGTGAAEDVELVDTFTGYGTPGVVKEKANTDTADWTGSAGNWTWEYTITELAAGGEKVYTYTYTVVEADAEAETPIKNSITATGVDPDGDDETETEVEKPEVTVKKTSEVERDGKTVTVDDENPLQVGDEITYTITVKNTGNVDLYGLTLADTFDGYNKPKDSQSLKWDGQANSWTASLKIPELPEGQTNTCIYTYTVVEEDLSNKLKNTATVTGGGLTDGDPDNTDDEELPVEDENPDVTVTKSLFAITRNDDPVQVTPGIELKVGDKLTYFINIVNSGNVDLEELTVTDTFSGAGEPSDVTGNDGHEVGTWKDGVWTATIETLPVNGTVTYTYTYTVVQADADKTLTNSAVVTGEDFPDGDPDNPPPQDEEEHEVKDDGKITLRPADITIYMGGKDGYEAVMNGNVSTSSNSLPEPGFYITLPDEVNRALGGNGHAADLSGKITVTAATTVGEERTWTLQKYGDSTSTALINDQEHFVYKIEPGEKQPAIRVAFTDNDSNTVTSDAFTLTDNLSNEYKMNLYTGDVDVASISLKIEANGQTFYCGYDAEGSTPGILTVRYAATNALITPATTNLDEEIAKDTKQFYVEVNDSQKFYINDGNSQAGVTVDADSVSLLADNLTGNNDDYNEADLYAATQKATSFEKTVMFGKYFDLVDAQNGNAWLTSDQAVTVFWPYPAGTDKTTDFELFHFDELDREGTAAAGASAIDDATPTKVTSFEKGEHGITFTTESFSPFVLVWENTQAEQPGDEDKPSGDDDDNNNNNNNNNTNNNQNKSTASASASASAAVTAPAAPAAAVIPQTGDDMPVGLLAGLALVAAGGLAALLVLRKRRSDR